LIFNFGTFGIYGNFGNSSHFAFFRVNLSRRAVDSRLKIFLCELDYCQKQNPKPSAPAPETTEDTKENYWLLAVGFWF